MKKISFIFMMILVLVGCGSSNKTTNYTLIEKNEYINLEITYQLEYVKDEVVGMEIENDYSKLKDNAIRDELIKQFDGKKELYKDQEGISINIDEKDKGFTAVIKVDFKKLDKKDYNKAIYNIEYYMKDDKLSLKKFDKNLKEMGFKEEK